MQRRQQYPGLDGDTVQAFIDVESNAIKAIEQVGLWARPNWNVVSVSEDYQAQLWDCVVCLGNCQVRIPPANASNRGAEITVVNTGVATTVYVHPISGLINGTSDDSPNNSRARTYVSSGEGWYSIG